jgi:hypothetical protein
MVRERRRGCVRETVVQSKGREGRRQTRGGVAMVAV